MGLKYLGIHFGGHAFMSKNWEGVWENVEGRLNGWKWLLPKMSLKGQVLVINNLVLSMLWHRLACMDPSKKCCPGYRQPWADFFWDHLQWISQSVLLLPGEEGGLGLVHLESRGVTFRVQFVQRLLCGPSDLLETCGSSCVKAM